MSEDEVRGYYASFGEREWDRLDRAEGVIEFLVNTHFLERFLPADGRVLDLGGGPGRYTEWLAGRGHQVVLADLSAEQLDIATRRLSSPLVEEIVQVDARNLSRWNDESFDAALVLGPLYHVPDEADRALVVMEAQRVVRPGGVLFFALMPVFGFVRRTASVPDERHHLTDAAFMRDLLEGGLFSNDIPGRFTHGWGARPEIVVPWFEDLGLTTLAFASSEGLASGMESTFVDLRSTAPAAFDAAMRVVYETATDPSLLGMAKHLLYVGRRT